MGEHEDVWKESWTWSV